MDNKKVCADNARFSQKSSDSDDWFEVSVEVFEKELDKQEQIQDNKEKMKRVFQELLDNVKNNLDKESKKNR